MPGLSTQEVQVRIDEGLVNEAVDPSTNSVEQIIKENVFTYFNLIFTVLAVLLILVGSFKDLSFMLIIIANTGIGIFQEIRSKNVLDNLKFDNMPNSRAIRNGVEIDVPSTELVLDDIVVLRSGMRIPADAEVVAGSCQVNESMITGESDEIPKNPGDGLYSGSYVISGECQARLTAVGRDAYINKLTIEATKQNKNDNRSQMVKSLDHLVAFIGVLIIPIGIILFAQQYVILGSAFRASVISMVAAVLGMIPEGLYMMASIAMVVSAVRLAQNEVLVQNMRCIETLARVDVLCVDKTGTITENEMKVNGMQNMIENIPDSDMRVYIGDLCHSLSADNETMKAMQAYFTETSDRKALSTCPFSSKYKYSGATFEDGNFVLGAPEFVLGSSFEKYAPNIELMSARGYRVMAFALTEEKPAGQTITGRVRLLAVVFLSNPIRESAKETFEYFEKNGVEVKVISGDNPVTVSNIAQQAGIARADRAIDARRLKTQEDVDSAVTKYTVFGRVTPEQKRMIVRSLKDLKKTVAMTGDGVNDVLALRDADCSIAMASGSEAASNASQLVLLDSNFGRMPSVVAEGRRVVNNIIKTASLYLTKNIFSLLLAMFSMISVLRYPLQPSQITLISMFTIGMPSFILSLEPNHDRIKGSFLGNTFKTAAPAGITIFLMVSALQIFGQIMNIRQSSLSTSSSLLVALGEFLILARVAKPWDRLHVGMMIVMVAGFFYAITFHSDLFGISGMNAECLLLTAVFLVALEAVFRYFYKFTSFLGTMLEKRKAGRKEPTPTEKRRQEQMELQKRRQASAKQARRRANRERTAQRIAEMRENRKKKRAEKKETRKAEKEASEAEQAEAEEMPSGSEQETAGAAEGSMAPDVPDFAGMHDAPAHPMTPVPTGFDDLGTPTAQKKSSEVPQPDGSSSAAEVPEQEEPAPDSSDPYSDIVILPDDDADEDGFYFN
jgi:cation-transporting ATPase E